MITRTVFTWLLLPIIAYTPTAPEILSRMEIALGRGKSTQVQVVREDSDGKLLEERTVTIPSEPTAADASSFLAVPYAFFTASKETVAATWPSLAREETPVTLGRLSGRVCYLVEGNGVRLWLAKDSFTPVQIEVQSEDSLSTLTEYRDMINISEKVRYPARTEVRQADNLLIVERIIPAAAGTEGP